MKNKTLSRALGYLGASKFAVFASALTALVSVFISLYIPILIGEALDFAIGVGEVDINAITERLITAVILILAGALLQWIMSAINNRICYRVVARMREEAFEKLSRLKLSYVDSHKHGEIVNRIVNDTERFGEGLLLGATQVFTGVMTIVGVLVFMFVINAKIAVAVVVLTPLSILVAKFIGKHTYDMFRMRSVSEAEGVANINEVIGNQKTVLAFSAEGKMADKFLKINDKIEKYTLKGIFFSSLTNPTTRFVNNIVYAVVALFGALIALATAGASVPFTIGQFSCLLSYTNQYTKPFNEISGIVAEFQGALASAGRVFELIDEDCEDDGGRKESLDVVGEVTFDDVSFSYSEDKPLIEGLTLKAPKGAKIAIVGPTGSGKTTLINLLMRFYDVTNGKICVDGTNINDVKRKALRECYGMVLQDTFIISGTVKENIAFGKPDATDEEIIAAAKSAHAHGFIKRLKDGYDTKIGEGAHALSEGQRQLICIARVMLTLPPMLILDEATSNIDTRTEMKIQAAFADMMKGRTSFVVAHRLSTIRDADLILVMKNGSIVESGTHEELLSLGGFYKFLYDSRTAGIEE